MSRVAVAAAVVALGLSLSTAVAHADPVLPGPPPGPPPPGPKTSFGDGTYAVGTDIMPGVYETAGPVEGSACYWKRSDADGTVANAMTKKPQTVQIEAGDTTFKTSDCQEWQMTDAAPPPKPNPMEVLGQLGSLIGVGAAPSGG